MPGEQTAGVWVWAHAVRLQPSRPLLHEGFGGSSSSSMLGRMAIDEYHHVVDAL